MKKDKFKFRKKPLNSRELLLDNDIMHEKNGFEDFDDNEMLEYLAERYGYASLALLYGYASPKQMKKANRKAYKEKTKGRHKHGKKIFDADFKASDMLYDAELNSKIIYYYRDVNNPEDVEMFDSLHDFDEFMNEEGIEISDEEVTKLMSREISHCALNPLDRIAKNRLRLMSSSSYGDLRFTNAELEYEGYYD